MIKEITSFAIKATIVIGLIVIAAVILDWLGVIDFGRRPDKAELTKVDIQKTTKAAESKYAGEAQEAIAAILAAAKVKYAETGIWVTDIRQLTRLQLDPLTKERWDFTLVPNAQGILRIQATSTSQMSGVTGKIVQFDVVQGKWSGYGID